MPPTGKLRPEQIAALTEWVKMGAPWPATPPSGGAAAGQAPDIVLTDAQRNFWSFKPVQKSPPPAVKSKTWVKSPIDAFVLAKLEAKGLKPAAPADRRTLIRRAYFDLIGLPPTPEAVDAFLADKSPDAFAKVVDHLLALPQYGERWGRRWLDVARYADSNGLDENTAFGNAYRYRDYVVAAFNKDKPYNTFIQEQLAGDLLPATGDEIRNERLTAVGFLSLGPKVLAEPDKAKMMMDIVDEQIEVTSKAFLGLTVACARCHNHKFDPIPTKDYYALAGIFKSTRTMESLNTVARALEHPIASPEMEAKKAEYDAKLNKLQSDLNRATDSARKEAQASVLHQAGRYLLAACELAQYPPTELTSVAELPVRPGDPARILIEAENYNRGNAHRDFEVYGKNIGIIHTTEVPTWAEWDVTVPAAGPYQVELRYAAAESRPVRLLINGMVVKPDAAAQVTGSFQPEGQRWEAQGIYAFQAGKNVVRIERNDSIPHFDKLLIVASPLTTQGGKPHLPIAQVAAMHNLNSMLLGHCAQVLRGMADIAFLKSLPMASTLSDAEFNVQADRLQQRLDAKSDTEAQAVAAELVARRGLLRLQGKFEAFYSDASKQAVKQADDALKQAQARAPEMPMALGVEEGKVEDCRVHIRGDTQQLGDEVPRHFLTVVDHGDKGQIDPKHSGRLELAQWLTDPNNPLPARVEVNRIWLGHFGEGLVRTPDNWGLLGEPPTHPELLDWLAATFEEQGWSIKKMHRLIMLSNAYQMSSTDDAKAELADPDNRLLWRMNRRRLEAEPFRDAILAVSGKLDHTLGGSLLTTKNFDYVTNDQSANAAQYSAPRRSLYLPIIRNALFDMFQAFDVGDPSMVNAKRATTTVASQALFVMNSPFVLEQSKAFAASLLARPMTNDADRIALAYKEAFGRPPTTDEVYRGTTYLSGYADRLAGTEHDAQKRRALAWDSLCQILFAANEFIYVN